MICYQSDQNNIIDLQEKSLILWEKTEIRVRDYKKMWKSKKENVFIFYSQFDVGMKYKVYCKASYSGNIIPEYLMSFDTISEAIR